VGQQHTGGWQQASVASTRQQYTELEVASLSCTGSGSFWHRLHCSMCCFLELVPLCPPALLPDADIAGTGVDRGAGGPGPFNGWAKKNFFC